MSYGITPNNATGYIGNLTNDQEAKLRELWVLIFSAAASVLSAVYEIDLPEARPNQIFEALDRIQEPTMESIVAALKGEQPGATNGEASVESSARDGEEKHQVALERIDALMNQNAEKNLKAELKSRKVTPAHFSKLFAHLRKLGVRESEIESMEKILSKMTPEEMCFAILIMMKQEHPDSLLLRFLRARKWDVGKGFGMMCTNILWRKQFEVDDDVLPKGEMYAVERSKNEQLSAKDRKAGNDFMEQLRMGKSFLHGFDRQGRPVNYVRVRIHKPGAQSQETLERYIVHVIEMTRLIVVPPIETGTVVFDMTGFTLANMEYQPVKFVIKCFEANYPESLGLLLIHNAPWIFASIWKLIRGWMDPVVASKVHFTQSVDDLDKFIDRNQIPQELNGDEDWEYKYLEPEAGENAVMEDTATRDALMYERIMIGLKMLAGTAAWISATTFSQGPPDNATVNELKVRREAAIGDFRQNYWKLDPFIRQRSIIDRQGVLKPGGTVAMGNENLANGADEGAAEGQDEVQGDGQDEGQGEAQAVTENGDATLLD